METSEEKKSAESKSKSQWFEVAVILLIAAVILISGVWLWKMSDVLKSPPGHVEVRHVYANFESETKRDKNEETQYTLYKQAEETLREQMNTWLTIVGFFGVLFGLIVPLASYLLQRRSLSEERGRIMEGVKESAAAAAEKAAEKASKEAADAKQAAEKAANDASNDAEEAKKSASAAEAEAQMAVEDLKTAKREIQAQLKDALERIEQASRDAKEAKAEAGKAQEMVREVGKTMQPMSVTAVKDGKSQNADGSKLEKIRERAERGDAEAQAELGWMYGIGDGVEKDEFEAVYWYRKAAKQGVDVAQFNLGIMYDFGRGVDKNYTEAYRWYRKAAEQGYADAENNLGVLLANGQGCEKNEQEALGWYRKAMEHGSAIGRKNVGEVYEKGRFGVEVNLTKAKELYQQVLADPNAVENVKKLAQEGLDRIAKLEAEK